MMDYICFLHQRDFGRFPESTYAIFENSDLEVIWDLVVVYEGIKVPTCLKYKEGGLVFISGEPPMSSCYPGKFINQFDELITSHPRLKHSKNVQSQQALNWHFGLSYSERRYKFDFDHLKRMPLPDKKLSISIITSAQQMMPGHNLRMYFLKKLEDRFPGQIHVYGKGIVPVDDKSTALLPFMFNICIENSSIKDYWTEKFADALLAYCVPIYYGCINIGDYFDENCFYKIDLNDIDGSIAFIEKILSDPQRFYLERLPFVKKARERLLNQYNLIPMIIGRYGYLLSLRERLILTKTVYPSKHFFLFKYLLFRLRLKRLIYRISFKMRHRA